MAGQISRVIGDIENLNIFSNTLTAQVKSARIAVNVETRENRAIKDIWTYPKELFRSWTIEASMAAESDDSMPLITALKGSGSITGAITFQPYSGGPTFSGTGIITTGTVETGDDTSYSITISGQGALA